MRKRPRHPDDKTARMHPSQAEQYYAWLDGRHVADKLGHLAHRVPGEHTVPPSFKTNGKLITAFLRGYYGRLDRQRDWT